MPLYTSLVKAVAAAKQAILFARAKGDAPAERRAQRELDTAELEFAKISDKGRQGLGEGKTMLPPLGQKPPKKRRRVDGKITKPPPRQ